MDGLKFFLLIVLVMIMVLLIFIVGILIEFNCFYFDFFFYFQFCLVNKFFLLFFGEIKDWLGFVIEILVNFFW